jgi:hypothetical protein
MTEVSGKNFGFLIAYILPGFISLWGISYFSPTVRAWLVSSSSATSAATVGGFLYITLASVGAGLTVSTVRWAFIDRLHALTGIRRPRWNDAMLQDRLAAFEALVENHYRYYQFYSNMLVALLLVVAARLLHSSRSINELNPPDCVILAVAVLYWAGSRDTLRRYFARTVELLGVKEDEGDRDDDERPQLRQRRNDRPKDRQERPTPEEGGGTDPSDG